MIDIEKYKYIYCKDSDGDEEWREYDTNENLIHKKNSYGDETFYEYDEKGHLIHKKSIINVPKHTYGCKESWFEYDDMGRCIHEKESDGDEVWFEYDGDGKHMHCRSNEDYESDDYPYDEFYDDNGNITRLIYHDGYEVVYEYDDSGNLIYETDSIHKTFYEYDKNGNCIYMKDMSCTGEEHVYEKWYKYDNNGNLISTKTSYPDDEIEYYEYDKNNNLIYRMCQSNTESSHKFETWYTYNNTVKEEVNEMGKQTILHAVFVDFNREVIREMYVPCDLYRHTDMPYIEFNDMIIKDILTPITPVEGRLDFYDKNQDRFNFKCPNIKDLAYEKCDVPNEIVIEILTYINEEGFEYYDLMSPGLWQVNEYGERYRMCDDAILYIINKTYVPKIKKTCEDKHVDYTWKDMFFEAFRELHLMLIDPDDEKDDYDEFECDGDCDNCEYCGNDEDDIEEFECDGVCFACDNEQCFDHPNHESKNIPDDEEDESEYNDVDNVEKFKCDGDGDCETCRLIECINNPKHNHIATLNNVYLYSDRCAGHCDECKRTFCITGERRIDKSRSVKDNTSNTKCDECPHRKECEKAKAEFSTKKMIVNNIDKTSKYPVKMIRVNMKPSSKRKYRKW